MCLGYSAWRCRHLRACRAAIGDAVVLLPCVGFFSGVFALFTMYLPPLFPTLLRTTGAGFCYNIGRIVAAAGTVFFGFRHSVRSGDFRLALLYTSFVFLPAAAVALLLPELPKADDAVPTPVRPKGILASQPTRANWS